MDYLIVGFMHTDEIHISKEEVQYGDSYGHAYRFMIVCFSIFLVIVPLYMIYLYTQNINISQQYKFSVHHGFLFDTIKLENNISAAFWLMYVLRRIFFVSIAFGMKEHTGA